MRLPRRVRILGHVFTIEKTAPEDLPPASAEDQRVARSVGKHFTYYGDCTVADRLIRINADLEDSILAETVLHEIGHALVELTGVRGLFKARQEETIVQALMHALTAVLQDNPSLLRLFRQN